MNKNVPFRWNLKQREQLGHLLAGTVAPSYNGFMDDVRSCCAKILSRARNSDIVFVGRSPESLYDYLLGSVEGTSYEHRIHMLNLSMRYEKASKIVNTQATFVAMKKHFSALELDPSSLIKRKQPVMFTDIVCDGYTFENLYQLIKYWSEKERHDFSAVKQKLRFLGLTWKVQSSRYIERWWQHVEWTKELSPSAIKNIAISRHFWCYMGNEQKKVEQSYRPEQWGKVESTQPSRRKEQLEALRLAYKIFIRAKKRSEKEKLAKQVARCVEMKEAWLRSLNLELKRKGGASCVSKH